MLLRMGRSNGNYVAKSLAAFVGVAMFFGLTALTAQAQYPGDGSEKGPVRTPKGHWRVDSYEPTAARLVYTAARSLGILVGMAEEDGLVTDTYEGTGTIYTVSSGSSWPSMKMDKCSVDVDYGERAMRIDIVSGGHRYIEAVSGEHAWDETDVPLDGPPVGKTVTAKPAVAQERMLQLAMSPFGAIKVAHENVSKITVTPLEHGTFVLAFPYHGDTMKVTLDRNRRPSKVEIGVVDPVIGKTTMEAYYSAYKEFEGRRASYIFFPSRIVQKIGGNTVLDLTVSYGRALNPYVVVPVPPSVEDASGLPQHAQN
jgi:hypothetical protein